MSGEVLREVLYALAPTVGVVLIFWIVVRAIVRADDSERRAAREFRDRGDRADGGKGPAGDV
jgi:hypothetical protein